MFELEEELGTTTSPIANNSTELLEEQDKDLDLPPIQPPMPTSAISAPTQSHSLFKAVAIKNARQANGSASAIPRTISPTQKISANEEREEDVLGTSSFTFAFSPPSSKKDSRTKGQQLLKMQLSKSADNSTLPGPK